MALPEDLLEIIVGHNCTDHTDSNNFNLKVEQIRMKSRNPDNEPKVTVTIPKSHLDFLNMVFPPSPPSYHATENILEDILIATPLEKSVEMANPTTESQAEPVCFSIVASDMSCQPSTDKLTNILASTSPLTVQTKALCDQNMSVPLTQNYKTGQDKHNSSINELVTSCETIPFVNRTSPDTTVLEEERNDDSAKSQNGKVSKKPKRNTKSLTFPPCNVCGGKASGLHYGVNSCEACKGFFRRYLLKKFEYKCTKDGKCEVIQRSRGICSSCRLKKCLNLGMSKDRVQMGRYSLTKRTETIKNMNQMKTNDVEMLSESDESHINSSSKDVSSELIGRHCCKTLNLNQSNDFSMELVQELTQAMIDMKPFGPVVTDEQVEEELKSHYEHYKSIVNLYGEMKPVPKEECYKLYKDYSIDVDGRMAELKECAVDIEQIITSYCNFAKHIPGFYKLPYIDQSNLLKTSRADVFLLLMHKGYSASLSVFLDSKGKGRHIDQCADKFMSRDVCLKMGEMYDRWQKLRLSREETALLMALVLMYPDRCKIQKRTLIESIQQSLADLLLDMLRKTHKSEASKRFTKMIDLVVNMRNCTEIYLSEYKELCNDKVLTEEIPMLTEFLLEDDKGEMCETNQ